MHLPHADFFAKKKNNQVSQTTQFCGDGDALFGVERAKAIFKDV
jgi:hypothetical protein